MAVRAAAHFGRHLCVAKHTHGGHSRIDYCVADAILWSVHRIDPYAVRLKCVRTERARSNGEFTWGRDCRLRVFALQINESTISCEINEKLTFSHSILWWSNLLDRIGVREHCNLNCNLINELSIFNIVTSARAAAAATAHKTRTSQNRMVNFTEA